MGNINGKNSAGKPVIGKKNNLSNNPAREKDNSLELSANDVEDPDKSSGHIMKDEGTTSSVNSQASNCDTKGDNKKGKKASPKVVIENRTKETLLLREKIRAANGPVRYSIDAGKSVEIKIGPQSTYYRLLVYAVVASSNKDTGLTIDSDMLSDATHIVFYKDEDNNKYVLKDP